MPRIFTTAPESYDYGYCQPVEDGLKRTSYHGEPVRVVEIEDPDYADVQTQRYRSGLYLALNDEEWDDVVESGLGMER